MLVLPFFLLCFLGVGFMEAPVITYVGEISEPRLRGILTSYSAIFITIGLIIEFLLGTLYDWRTTAFISSFVPIITIIAISQVSNIKINVTKIAHCSSRITQQNYITYLIEVGVEKIQLTHFCINIKLNFILHSSISF